MSHYSINLGSPIYCTVFVDQDRIILGGGGGSSKNHLILHEYGLPSGSDSPMSIDLDRSTGLVLSGINSSPTELKLGRNLHLRTFKLLDSSLEPKESYQILDFDQSGNDYQRINCLSRASPQLLAVGGSNNQLKLLYYPSLKAAISTPISCPAGELLTVDFSEDGTHFLICSTQAVRIFSIIFPSSNQEKKGKKEKKEIKLNQSHELIPTQTYPSTSFRSARFGRGPTSETIFTILNPQDRKKGARVLSWNSNDGSLRRSRLISTRPVTAFDLSESGKLLALSSSDLTVSVIDALSLRPILTILHAHEFPVTCLKFSIDSSRLISASADTTIRVIEIPERRSAWRSSASILIFLTIFMILISFILNQTSLNLDLFLDQLFSKLNSSFNL
ncbi:quinon protein alcohol dehydrogenase-like superfamily [Melampsora americana]|nr:quinon protein alcohol dehydrogenase-like superfamily [Melampsora americana]